MRWSHLAAALAVTAGVVLGSACGGGGGAPKAPKAEAVDERKAEKDARGLVTEIYQTLNRSSNTDGLMALLAEPLVVFGPRRTDAHASRSDALVAMRTLLDERGKDARAHVTSHALSVVASPGGLSAWAIDVVDVEGTPMAMTAVLSNDDDFWVVVAAALGKTPAQKTMWASVAKDALVPPAMGAPGKVTGSADGAADRFKRGLADPASWGEDLAQRGESVFIGPSAGEVTRGKKAIAKLWAKRAKGNTRYASVGDMAGGVTHDGQLAWVTVPAVQFADDQDPLPVRLFGVYERSKSQWSLIALQESVAVDDPGIGANFRKITPPAVKAPEAPKDKPKDEGEKKPKKTKKKKRSSDD